jgi:hypothetical protein
VESRRAAVTRGGRTGGRDVRVTHARWAGNHGWVGAGDGILGGGIASGWGGRAAVSLAGGRGGGPPGPGRAVSSAAVVCRARAGSAGGWGERGQSTDDA